MCDSNVKNGVLLSVTNLTPNITDLWKAISRVSLKLVMFISPVREIILFDTANSVHILLVLSEVTN